MFSIDFFIRGVLHDLEIGHEQINDDLVQRIRERFNPESLRPQKEDIINIFNSLAVTGANLPEEEALQKEPGLLEAEPEKAPVDDGDTALLDDAVAETASAVTAIAESGNTDQPVETTATELTAAQTGAEAAVQNGNETAASAETVVPAEDGGLAATTPAPAAELPQNPAGQPLTPQPNPVPPPKKEPAPAIKTMHLPNAKEKEWYSITMDWPKLGMTDMGEHRIEGLVALGLNYDEESGIIQGIPAKAGEYELKLFFRYKGDGHGKPEMVRTINLFINHDPRSLWTEHEPEAGSPYWKEHTDAKRITSGQKTMIAASKRGRSHAKDAKFREDHFDILYNDLNGWHFMTVSDGAGSAKFSRQGSKLACETVTEHLNSDAVKELIAKSEPLIAAYSQSPGDAAAKKAVKDFLYYTICAAVIKAYAAIEQEAQNAGAPVKDFSATLLVSICKKFDFGWFVGGFWIGDGGIGIYNKDAAPVLLGTPDSGEYSGQTRFITMAEVRTAEALFGRIHFHVLPGFDALVLMSDGITDAWFHTDHNLTKKEKWDELFAEIGKTVQLDTNNPDAHTQLLNWLDFWVKGEYDDRTIAIMM